MHSQGRNFGLKNVRVPIQKENEMPFGPETRMEGGYPLPIRL